MRFLIMLTLLAFPIAEIWLLVILGNLYGWWVVLYLIAMIVLGLQLIRNEKHLFTGRIMQSLMQNQHPVKALFGSARNIIAGILLIIPGVISDMIAVILLLMPVQQPVLGTKDFADDFDGPVGFDRPRGFNKRDTNRSNKAANDDIIEGEFKRED